MTKRYLQTSQAKRLLTEIVGRKVLIIGDVMLDEFLWGKARRIAPEAPVPVVEIERETLHLGGAANVAANLAELGAVPILVGVVGKDISARRLITELERCSINSALVTDSNRPTTLKTRIIAHSQHVVRADREKKTPVDQQTQEALVERFLAFLPEAEAVVISDYQKGVVTRQLLAAILPPAKERVPVCVDPKMRDLTAYLPATVITPNIQEAEAAVGFPIDSPQALLHAGQAIKACLNGAKLIITRGEEGMTIFDEQVLDVPAVAREVYDVTGAGDTVIATLAASLACNATLLEAALLASHAAGIVVGKVGTATATPEEVLLSVRQHHPKVSPRR
ncbi:MAG: D-glycero-beta-D-manno-heptose-7-phosphate kinase [Acidobacteriota bacterium]|nr:D-glycero-beta-D-manno-heptose-7-phosphate kinase [Blastocatellia bacterium]MDW8412739.1 D-glycero-beta-D-manno-heptose-7-phosphate kinase [Acidobacteriota bacterium]